MGSGIAKFATPSRALTGALGGGARDIAPHADVTSQAPAGLQLQRGVVEGLRVRGRKHRADVECRPDLAYQAAHIVGATAVLIRRGEHTNLVVIDTTVGLGGDVELPDAAAMKYLAVAEKLAPFLEERPMIGHELLRISEADGGDVAVHAAEIRARRNDRRDAAPPLIPQVHSCIDFARAVTVIVGAQPTHHILHDRKLTGCRRPIQP